MLQIHEYILPLDFTLDKQENINADLPKGSKILSCTFCYDQRKIFYGHDLKNNSGKKKHIFYMFRHGKPTTENLALYDHFKTFDAANATFHLFKLKT